MRQDEPFLARWSRRKREAADDLASGTQSPAASETQPEPAAETDSDTAAATAQGKREAADKQTAAGAPAPAAFDPGTLPPIESIAADSDIRAFLAPGVPEELTRAALRRAWATDPAIRDFIGLAENQWDFNAPDGVPGFGPLQMTEEVRQLIANTISSMASPATGTAAAPAGLDALPGGRSEAAANPAPQPPLARPTAPEDRADALPGPSEPQLVARETIVRDNNDVAMQQDEPSAEYLRTPGRKPHGGALPV